MVSLPLSPLNQTITLYVGNSLDGSSERFELWADRLQLDFGDTDEQSTELAFRTQYLPGIELIPAGLIRLVDDTIQAAHYYQVDKISVPSPTGGYGVSQYMIVYLKGLFPGAPAQGLIQQPSQIPTPGQLTNTPAFSVQPVNDASGSPIPGAYVPTGKVAQLTPAAASIINEVPLYVFTWNFRGVSNDSVNGIAPNGLDENGEWMFVRAPAVDPDGTVLLVDGRYQDASFPAPDNYVWRGFGFSFFGIDSAGQNFRETWQEYLFNSNAYFRSQVEELRRLGNEDQIFIARPILISVGDTYAFYMTHPQIGGERASTGRDGRTGQPRRYDQLFTDVAQDYLRNRLPLLATADITKAVIDNLTSGNKQLKMYVFPYRLIPPAGSDVMVALYNRGVLIASATREPAPAGEPNTNLVTALTIPQYAVAPWPGYNPNYPTDVEFHAWQQVGENRDRDIRFLGGLPVDYPFEFKVGDVLQIYHNDTWQHSTVTSIDTGPLWSADGYLKLDTRFTGLTGLSAGLNDIPLYVKRSAYVPPTETDTGLTYRTKVTETPAANGEWQLDKDYVLGSPVDALAVKIANIDSNNKVWTDVPAAGDTVQIVPDNVSANAIIYSVGGHPGWAATRVGQYTFWLYYVGGDELVRNNIASQLALLESASSITINIIRAT